jgi:hypothetical protein
MAKISLKCMVLFASLGITLGGCAVRKNLTDEVLYVSVYDSSPMPLMDLVTIGSPKRYQDNQWVATLNDKEGTQIYFTGYWIASPATETDLLFRKREKTYPISDQTEEDVWNMDENSLNSP